MASSGRAVLVIVPVPASNERARVNFRKTVEKLWSVDDLLRLGVKLPEGLVEKLRSAGRFAMWGATPRAPGVRGFFRRLGESGGGVVAFYRDGRIICWGRIFAWARNANLARSLWGETDRGDTWEYIYFIRDLRCGNIPWHVVRDELGYSEGFHPRSHVFVPEDRLEPIVKKYGDLLSFFDSLAGVEASGAGFEQYPFLVQSLKKLDSAALLDILGAVALRLAERGSRLSKEELTSVLREVLESLGQSGSIKEYQLLLNDLQRLGLVAAEESLGEQPRGVEVAPGPLLRRVVEAIEYCRSKSSCGNGTDCRRVGGAVTIVGLLVGLPAGNQRLREVLAGIYVGEPLEQVASEIDAGFEDVLKILEAMRRLIEEAIHVAIEAAEKDCIPRLYVPLGLRGRIKHEQ